MSAEGAGTAENTRLRPGLRGLGIATFAFLVIFAASAVPIPLYSEYKATIGLSDVDISATMLMYLFGVVLTLFLSGSLSDAVGRRPLAAVALLLGCFLFLGANNSDAVLAARVVQGISCGLAMSAISALVVDSATGRYESLGMAMAGCGALLGVMTGSLAVGFLCMATSNHELIYWIMIALLAVGVVLVPFAPETVVRRASLRTACKPVLSIEPKLRRVFPLAACAYISSWGVGTYFQSFSSPVAVDCFGTDSTLIASIILALSMAPSVLGAPIEARLKPGFSLRVAMSVFFVSVCGMCLTMALHALVPFLLFTALFGLSTGMCLSGSLRLLFGEADASTTATVVSTINLVGYIGSAALSIMMSALIDVMPLEGVLVVLAVFVFAAGVIVFARTRRVQDEVAQVRVAQ